ncbi:hypothetical protein IGI04_030072 [Brassica rapa subsp. trilocularis]|uniref:Peptidase A2 domain-containing protein n=1 Tax=Brassica rapa subsp. trilocularis TaxID=1813537 RepID=A0ABQ7LPN1_BRACM|nr:hypothetical protein IGI04_030072 [Brassica rapa subsp. trilocularis]
MSSNISCMQQLGIYRYYNLQHRNSGPASNIISNQTIIVDRSQSFDNDRYYTAYVDRYRVVKNGQKIDAQGILEEGDFKIESSMSLGGSQWCRPMSMNSHRSTDHDEDRWTDYSSHRSTSSANSTECNAVRILTHEEFAAKHPHPPSPFYDKIDRPVESTINRQGESDVDRHNTPPIDRQAPLTYRVRLPSIDNDYINALRPPPKPLASPPEPKPNPLNSSPEPVQENKETEGRRLRKRKEKIPKNLKREANDKEMDGFTKRVLRIPIEKPFDEAYFTHRLWMFFRETKVTEEDIRRMFHQVREKMKQMITLTKKSDPVKFAIPCVVKGVEFPHSMCDTGASVSILPMIMADQLGLTIESSTKPFTFVDLSEKRSGGIIRDLEVQIGNALVPVDFHVLDIELNWNSSLLLGSSFLPTVGAVINYVDYGKELGFIGACHCGAEYESEYKIEYSESIDTPTFPSIDSNASMVTDDRNNTSLDVMHPLDHFASPNHCYQHFAFQPPSKRAHDDYSIGSWTDSGFHESFAVDTVITSPNEEHSEEYDEDYWKERAIKMSLQDERLETHKFTNTFPTSFNAVHSTSVDTHPRPAKQPLTSIDTPKGTSIDIRAAAKIQEQENIPSPTRDPDGNARATDGRILQVSREDIADILQVANGPDNLFSQQRGTPDVIQTDPNSHAGVATTKINPDLSRQPKGQASIDGTTETLIDRITPTSIDRDEQTSIDRRYECGNRAFDMYGARKFTWEQRDEYGVYRDERGHARGVAGEMIPVTKDNIRKILESHICLPEHATSFTPTRLAPELYTKEEIDEMVFGICGAQEKLGEDLKTLVDNTHQPLDRGYNELFRCMAEMRTEIESLPSIDAPRETSIDVSLPTAQIPAEPQCSTQHRDEWKVSYIDTRINDVYCPLNNNVDWLRTKIELLQQDLDTIRKKDQQPATSIDMCTFTSLDAKVSAMNERLRTYEDMHDRFISPAKSASIDRLRGPWIDGKKPVKLLPYTAAQVDKITSKIYTALDTMEERPDKRCDDIYIPFDNKISGLDNHAEWLQKEVKAIKRQLAAQHQISASIDKTLAKSIDGNSPRSTNEYIIASIDAESTPIGEQLIHKTVESMQKELTELSAYAYDNIGWHQVSIDNIQERLQNISKVLEKMDDKWTRND